ncbi:ribosome-associated translation inhibitor RaiA [Methylomonas paludis]|uniref:Ribosome hibernation promoting factor n=1 Tax=Methylomonas paludis TaxID=1173101 RepID=A0A975R9L1_9GAMM|nr:ribosome-associated translation inhibitor RaiA [Methylomonas paludis]QWF71177.1 ribosome-associated translation inhibitor RaiA [Methylomonas paludis]
MQISITGHHVEVTDSLKSHIEDKIGILKRHFDNVVDIHVILTVEKLEQKAEATVQISGAKLFAEDVQADMYVAIDNMVDKLDRQIVKFKEKNQNHR